MHILILGGTLFLGPHLVEEALVRGHQVTLLHRGTRTPEFSQPVEHLYADRTADLKLLEERSFDAVIDTSGENMPMVERSTRTLRGRVRHYAFISSIRVYSSFIEPGLDEWAPVLGAQAASSGDPCQVYGAMKARCETLVEDAFPGAALLIRPSIIVGPYDPSDRLTYWVRRLSEGGPTLLPGGPERPMQFIDVRDLAAFTLKQVEAGASGVFNVAGPQLTFGELVQHVERVTDARVAPVWVADADLLEQGLAWETDLPLWIPPTEWRLKHLLAIGNQKALDQGLRVRSPEETIRDIFVWDYPRRRNTSPLAAGISRTRESSVLASLAQNYPSPPRDF